MHQSGFALVAGVPGTGKSVAMRLLASRLSKTDGLSVAAITHPSSRLSDFYREMGELFGITLLFNNRWASFKNLRERWLTHLDETRLRPVLLIDEAQELQPSVFAELRLLASTDFDSRAILSISSLATTACWRGCAVRSCSRWPRASGQRLVMSAADPGNLPQLLDHLLDQAGNRVSGRRVSKTPSWRMPQATPGRSP